MPYWLRRVWQRFGRYELLAWVTGFVLMSYELVASRLLAPTLGSSIYIWTSVIGVVIAAMALGYAYGGWLADRRARVLDVVLLLLVAAVCVLVTGFLHGYVLHTISAWDVDARMQALVAALVLFTPTSFTLAVLSPYLARLRISSLKRTGSSVAGLSAANAVGGIMGTFCTGFWFFGFVGSVQTLLFLSALLIMSSFAASMYHWRAVRAVALVALWFVPMTRPVLPMPVTAWEDTPTASYVIASPMHATRPMRVLMSGPGGYQSGVYEQGTNELVFAYTRTIADIAAIMPTIERILILGGGTFTLAEHFGTTYPAATVDVVELDPHLEDIATRYFRFDKPDNVHVIAQDARNFIQYSAQGTYDLVVVDVYNDITVPFSMVTTEFTESLAAHVSPRGLVAVNMIGSKNTACIGELASVHRSYSQEFSRSLFFPLIEPSLMRRQNMIALYSHQASNAFEQLPGAQDSHIGEGMRLTDNYAPIERLTQRCAEW